MEGDAEIAADGCKLVSAWFHLDKDALENRNQWVLEDVLGDFLPDIAAHISCTEYGEYGVYVDLTNEMWRGMPLPEVTDRVTAAFARWFVDRLKYLEEA